MVENAWGTFSQTSVPEIIKLRKSSTCCSSSHSCYLQYLVLKTILSSMDRSELQSTLEFFKVVSRCHSSSNTGSSEEKMDVEGSSQIFVITESEINNN